MQEGAKEAAAKVRGEVDGHGGSRECGWTSGWSLGVNPFVLHALTGIWSFPGGGVRLRGRS
ncbi:MAG TPA: hypothetical protein PKU91_06225, partial [Phycisphaerales bacterium]|nr:hypothetical protein [Phycisphaerales bacterium]